MNSQLHFNGAAELALPSVGHVEPGHATARLIQPGPIEGEGVIDSMPLPNVPTPHVVRLGHIDYSGGVADFVLPLRLEDARPVVCRP